MESLICSRFMESPSIIPVIGKDPVITYLGKWCQNLEPEEDEKPKYYAVFFGIPYAAAPLGEKRFLPPKPYDSKGALYYDASAPKSKSLQKETYTGLVVGSEDCLYLNIYLPKKPQNISELLPVLVYFHGGGFYFGSGNIDDRTPDSIIKHEIIFLTVNYRLGALGFMNMRAKSCQGNAGLKDQVMALKWIRKNISAFKGNPENVTICGESAGGTCVNFHLVSPQSKGLFQRAIVQSGGIYCPWGYNGHQREIMLYLKSSTSLQNVTREVLVEILKRERAEVIVDIDNSININMLPSNKVGVLMGPSVEFVPDDAFIPDVVENLMEKAEPVPILAGITEREGSMIFEGIAFEDPTFVNWVKDRGQFCYFLMVNLRWSYEVAKNHVDTLRDKYFQNLAKMSDCEIEENLATLCTDIWFRRFYDNFRFGGKKSAPLRVYKFSYLTEINNSQLYPKKTRVAGHGDDIDYLFCPSKKRKHFTPFRGEVLNKIKNICSLWASFCKTGIPKSDLEDVMWTPHTEENPCYLHITEKLTMVNERLYAARWDDLNDLVESEPIIPSLASSPIASSMSSVIAMSMEEMLKNRFDKTVTTASDFAESTTLQEEIPNVSQTLKGVEASTPSNSDLGTPILSNSERLKRRIPLELSTSTENFEAQLSPAKKSSLDGNNAISNQTE